MEFDGDVRSVSKLTPSLDKIMRANEIWLRDEMIIFKKINNTLFDADFDADFDGVDIHNAIFDEDFNDAIEEPQPGMLKNLPMPSGTQDVMIIDTAAINAAFERSLHCKLEHHNICRLRDDITRVKIPNRQQLLAKKLHYNTNRKSNLHKYNRRI